MSGWKVGREIYVVLKNKSRRGILVARKGSKWRFKPHGYTKDVSICPIRFKWRYAFKDKVVAWKKKLSVVLIKSSLQPFKYKCERFGTWQGAACKRTLTASLPVWQVVGTNMLYVGHLGMWKLVVSDGNKLCPMLDVPKDDSYFVGRGRLTPKRFRCLKTVCRRSRPRCKTYTKNQLYKIPTRDELGGRFFKNM